MATEQLAEQAEATPAAFTPVLSARWVLRWTHAVCCAGFVLLWLALSYAPLSRTGAWVHVAAGNHLFRTGHVAPGQHTMPLAEGGVQTAGAWLSQLLMAAVNGWRGADALTWLFAVVQFAAMLLVCRAFYVQTKRKRLAIAGLAAVMIAWSGCLLTLQPQIMGGLCLAAMLCLLAPLPVFQWRALLKMQRREQNSTAPPLYLWICLPLLMCLWANVDFSFIAGVLAIAAMAVGMLIQSVGATRSVVKAIADPQVQKWIYLAELCALATLLSPAGVDQWVAVLRTTASNPLFVPGSGHLVLFSVAGLVFSLGWLFAIGSVRMSGIPLHAGAVVLLTGGSLLVAWNASLLHWVAPFVVLAFMPYVAHCCHRWGWLRRSHAELEANWNQENEVTAPESSEQPWRFAFTLLCGLLVWTGFALSPISATILGGKERKPQALFDRQTPHGVASYLQKQPAKSLIWAPASYGDYLAYRAGNDTGPAPVFATSQFNRLPERVRGDYRKILLAESGWERLLDRYAVDVLVVDKEQQDSLYYAAIRTEEPWDRVFEDEQSAVFRRRPEPLETTK